MADQDQTTQQSGGETAAEKRTSRRQQSELAKREREQLRANEKARDELDKAVEAEGGARVSASISDNQETEHTHSGTTTRHDATDQGVPVAQGPHEAEPIGPEDALGRGGKRGDYSHPARLGGGVVSHESVALPGGGTPIRDDAGNVVDYAPVSALEPQAPRASDQSEIPAGHKGGVGPVGAEAASPPGRAAVGQ